jgi:hypothetical protein
MGAISRGRGGGRTHAASRAEQPAADAAPARPLTPGETAWLAAIPTAAVAVLAILLLGPPLGRALLAPVQARVWSEWYWAVRPEPVEQGRFLVALVAPLLLAGLTVVGVRLRPRATSATLAALVLAAQVVAVAFVAVCLLRQHGVFGSFAPPAEFAPPVDDDFTLPALLVAAAATVPVVLAIRSAAARAALARWTRETGARRLVVGCVAIAAIAVWLLHAFNTDRTIAAAFEEVLYSTYFTLDETFAVLDERSPLVNFAAQYGSLWPYAYAAGMSLLGATLAVWTALALTTTGLGMLAIYAVLRRAARSSIRGLLLFLPVLATSFLMLEGTRENRYTFANYFGTFPLRYAGPSMLAWLVARHLGGERPRRAWPLFLAAGLVVLNNADAGVPALGATAAALLWGAGRPSRAGVGRLALHAVGGLAAAFALVSALTLARAGSLPHVALLLRYSRLFASTGFAMYPMPTIGLHLVIYLTYLAALGVATVRAIRAEPDRLLTGMLAWSGAFGLGTGAYFAGRSTPDDLPALFLPWSFALALLLIPALASLRDASWRRPPVAATACLFGFLAMACSLAQTPTPWEQLDRLGRSARPILAQPLGQAFVARHTHRGERVAILQLLGHRIGANLGVVNVLPYSNGESVLTIEQLDETVAALHAAGARKLFVDRRSVQHELLLALADLGFRRTVREGRNELWLARGTR